MGCFNEFCDITNAPITVGTPCVVIVSVPDKYHLRLRAKSKTEKSEILEVYINNRSNDIVIGEMIYPPNIEFVLFGKYDDYGGITEMEDNPFFEKFCQDNQITLEELLNCATRKDTFWLKDIHNKISAAVKHYAANCNVHFVLRNVFDIIANEYKDFASPKWFVEQMYYHLKNIPDSPQKQIFINEPTLFNYLQGYILHKNNKYNEWKKMFCEIDCIFKKEKKSHNGSIFSPSGSWRFESTVLQEIVELMSANKSFCKYIEDCITFWYYINRANIVLKTHREGTQSTKQTENKIFKKLIKTAYKKQ